MWDPQNPTACYGDSFANKLQKAWMEAAMASWNSITECLEELRKMQ
jgi:hypothetical protein